MSTLYNRKIQSIVIHHMGDGKQPTVPIAQRWNPYNYEFPEYDFGVEFDGTIRNGRPLNYQGSHCISDKPPYSQKGNQWWNQNSIGIGLAGDFTKFPMPKAQFNGLVSLVKKLMIQYNLTLDDVYPHGQVTYTDCPGCTYSKVTALKGLWNYDEFESAIRNESNNNSNSTIQSTINNNKGDDNVLEKAVLLYSKDDYFAGGDVALKYNCAIFIRPTDKSCPKEAFSAKELFVIGGSSVKHPKEILLSGNNKFDTCAEVNKFLG